MRHLSAFLLTTLLSTSYAQAQSSLLESVKRNKGEAIELCNQFKKLNSKGISATSKEAINKLSNQRNLNAIDAEILSIYVIGLYCPEIK